MRCCSVPGCSNNSNKCPKGFKFYSFPSGSRDQNNRKDLWIKAVNKKYSNGNPWVPSQYSCICEVHFVGSKVNEDPRSYSYLPTLHLRKEVSYCRNPRKSSVDMLINRRIDFASNSSTKSLASGQSIDLRSLAKKDIGYHTKRYLGDGDVHSLLSAVDLEKGTCRYVATQSSSIVNKMRPTARWGHTMTMMSEEALLLIGGQGEKDALNRDALWKLDLTQAKWSLLESSGQRPESRMGHSAVYNPLLRYLYLFGGSKKKKWFNDVYVLDVDEFRWRLVETKGFMPAPRSYHSCVLYEHQLWVFGGTCPNMEQDECTNDVYIFDCLDERWIAPEVEGSRPRPRSGHSGSLVQNKMVVFGGWDAPTCFNDVHILDMAQKKWFQPAINGSPPSHRSWHSSCILSGCRILIHGGFDGDQALDDLFILDINYLTWTYIQLQPTLNRRAGHTTICLPYRHENDRRDQVLMFGGGNNEDSFYQDLINIMIPF